MVDNAVKACQKPTRCLHTPFYSASTCLFFKFSAKMKENGIYSYHCNTRITDCLLVCHILFEYKTKILAQRDLVYPFKECINGNTKNQGNAKPPTRCLKQFLIQKLSDSTSCSLHFSFTQKNKYKLYQIYTQLFASMCTEKCTPLVLTNSQGNKRLKKDTVHIKHPSLQSQTSASCD